MLKTLISNSSFRLSCLNNKILANNLFGVSRRSTSNTSTESKQDEKVENVTDEEGFRPVYRNVNLKLIAVINKLNPVLLKGCPIVLPPIVGVCYWFGFFDYNSLLGTFYLASSIVLCLQSFSFGTQRLVGFIYLNKKNDLVKISYVTYFGRREDIILPIESIMSFSDSPITPFDYLYRRIRTFDTNTIYKIDMRLGDVLDEQAFKTVFGEYKT